MTRVFRLGPALAVTMAAVLLSPTSAGSQAFPSRLELPDGFLPEGIALGPGPTAWFGSRANGDIVEIDLTTGERDVISPGPGTPSVGLKSDALGRLFVAGGPAGNGRVVDIESGDIVASYQFTTDPSFVNDVVLTPEAAWFTDSLSAQLYAVPLGPGGGLPDQSDVVTLPLTGDWVQGSGFAANGISQTPDGDALLVVHSTRGELYRVDPGTGATQLVDLGGASLTNGDGLLLDGRTLYVVRNRLNHVAVLELSKDGTSGALVDTISSPDFDVPTTVAKFGPWLYLPNARFTTPPTPDTDYWVTRVPS